MARGCGAPGSRPPIRRARAPRLSTLFSILTLTTRSPSTGAIRSCTSSFVTPRERFRDDKEDIVELLLCTGTDPLRRDRLGDTALHFLAGDTRPAGPSPEGYRLLRLLLEGCPEVRAPCLEHINSKNDFANTPLVVVVAVLYNHVECVQLLLEHGADPYEPGEFGITALEFAVERDYLPGGCCTAAGPHDRHHCSSSAYFHR
ncbi:hypothetical protein M406DRAFT_335284 [Cryphonectria parasitica EP155]|uniref:Uncharacterized protein n=1 Tax=Cryphonectria parasitica (strain ATCC 38755 / EP155) TaxID=660469 RepID=A0A9P4XSW3_CRYP1|nr:uncharacterized protein M406DRAFT_335284 [Cryphonectria parasitica EP155]KAF3760080.1 hypothetical protein M406DRAFT_335284 [Cryphonectria parasitica EP155]